MLLARLGGLSMLAFVPMLLIGVALYGRVGISSQSEGSTALARIAAAGTIFPIMNTLFHLGAFLLLPGGIALLVALRTDDGSPWLAIGTASLLIALATAGIVFALNQGLWGVASHPMETDAARAAGAVAADMNLRTQQGAELVQSLALGAWLLASAIALQAAGWDAWLAWLGVAGGIGFVLAGLSSVLMGVPILGIVLGASGALGLVLFAIWDLTVGLRLLTL